jgi:hypothetical protein
MLGQVVQRSETAVSNGFINAPISLTQSIANGVYFVHVTTGNESATFRLVLNK